MSETYLASPSDPVRDQVARYEASDGTDGGTLEGRPIVILTTIGNRTGAIRKNPVIRIPHGDSYIAVDSNAGAATHPAWYRHFPEYRQRAGSREIPVLLLGPPGSEPD